MTGTTGATGEGMRNTVETVVTAPIRLRVEHDGDPAFECSAEEFIRDNPELRDEIEGLAVGGLASFGGGAEPLAVVERVE